jgi:release factor glutamine methyltransferase
MAIPGDSSPTSITQLVAQRPTLAPVMYAMWGRAEGRRLARELRDAGIPVLVLKGPELQERLYGTPAAYESSDIDVLIHSQRARRARTVMTRNGWTFEPENGVLWRLSAAASFERDGFRTDLHWGLHAAHLPSWTIRPLERALWERAIGDPSGFLVPDPESLFVFLAVHAVGHEFERPEWVENVHAAGSQVFDWERVWRIARAARVTNAVRSAMSEHAPGTKLPVLDGVLGSVIWWGTYIARGHVAPQGLRDRLREAVAMRREGFGFTGLKGNKIVHVGSLDLVVEPGVFEPQGVTIRGVELAASILGSSPRIALDIGTGAGSVALTVARRWASCEVHAGDISARAVRCATRNADRLGVDNITFHTGSLLSPMPAALAGRVDLALSNVPYVPSAGGRDVKAWEVPLSTIYGPDADGLGFMRDLCRDLPRFLRPGGVWVFQIGDLQLEPWAAHLLRHGFEPLMPDVRRPGKAIVGAARWKGKQG